jgi:hypothetical protein
MKKLNRKTKNKIILLTSLALIALVVVALLMRNNSTLEQNYHIDDPQTITKVVIDDKDGNHLELVKQNVTNNKIGGTYEKVKFKNIRIIDYINSYVT